MKSVFIVLVLFLYGCTTKYVPLEVVKYDSLMIEKLMRDSVYVRDSVYLKEKGDTIYQYKDKYVYVYKSRVDTFFAERIHEVEIPVPVERKLTWWERKTQNLGDWIVDLIIIFILYRLLGWLIKKTRKE